MALPSDSGSPASSAPNYGGAQASAAPTSGFGMAASQQGGLLSATPSYGAVAMASSASVASVNYGGTRSQVQAAHPGLPATTTTSIIFPSYIGGFAIGLSPIGVG